MRQTFDINWGTVLTLGVPLILGGIGAYYNLADRMTAAETRGKLRGDIADNFQAETKAKLTAVQDLPMRVTALETQQKEINLRLDRLGDLILSGQDTLRRDLATSTETLRKDVASLGTKVEVLSDRMGVRPQPGVLVRPR